MSQLLKISHRIHPLGEGGTALCISCIGVYEIGAAGHAQANQIYEAAIDLLKTTQADCLLLDYTGLDYQWGDDMWLTFQVDHPKDPRDFIPFAVVVGPKCTEAIKSLLEEDGGYDSWLDAGYLYFDEVQALSYLAGKVGDVEPRVAPDRPQAGGR